MEKKPRCKKCGRILTATASIARGIGSTCAGISPNAAGWEAHVKFRRSSGHAFQGTGIATLTAALMPGDLPGNKISRREMRRRLFEARKPFQCGIRSGRKIPLFYEPSGENDWKESDSGSLISQERLQDYLRRYRFI